MLYEVITHALPAAVPVPAQRGRPGAAGHRRNVDASGAVPRGSGSGESCVITSYSIHYTKLYDPAYPDTGKHG